MLTLEVLYAVLQGLDPSYLTHLDRNWSLFCIRISMALKQGLDPFSAFKDAVLKTRPHDFDGIRSMLNHAYPVMRIGGLSRRQQEALVALRYAQVASLTTLTQVLAQDRSNVLRSMKALIAKGFALKFFRKEGVFYYALPGRLEKSVKVAINRMLLNQLGLPDSQPDQEQPTTLTTLTTPTTLTIPTMAQELTTMTTVP